MRSAELISPQLAKYNQQKKRWSFPNGSIIQFCHLEHETNVYDYQSQQFDLICFDEATHFTRFQYSYMKTRNRSTNSNVIRPIMLLGTNPGNIGHAWFKEEFVEIGEPEKPHEVEIEDGKEVHMFIPAFLSDNLALEERDPEYRKQLENQPEHIRRQLLDGDWDVAEGVAFTEWNKKYHVCEPFAIPDNWIKFRAYDHGYVKPYACLWFAIDHDGRLYCYRELYPFNGTPDKGSQETPAEIADKIMQLEAHDKNIQYAVADDAIFGGKQDNSPSIAEQFAEAFGNSGAKHWSPVGKGPRSRIQGKLELHHRLRIPTDKEEKPTGDRPMLVIFNNCRHLIRTLPNLILDEKNPEDVDTTQEDHIYDALRYSAMSRPMATPQPKPEETLIQKHKKKIQRSLQMNRRIL